MHDKYSAVPPAIDWAAYKGFFESNPLIAKLQTDYESAKAVVVPPIEVGSLRIYIYFFSVFLSMFFFPPVFLTLVLVSFLFRCCRRYCFMSLLSLLSLLCSGSFLFLIHLGLVLVLGLVVFLVLVPLHVVDILFLSFLLILFFPLLAVFLFFRFLFFSPLTSSRVHVLVIVVTFCFVFSSSSLDIFLILVLVLSCIPCARYFFFGSCWSRRRRR